MASRSPYAKYLKRPYRYSELYGRWAHAARAGKSDEARFLGRQHTAQFLRPARYVRRI